MDDSVQRYREFYARFIVSSADYASERLVAAFASVKRERKARRRTSQGAHQKEVKPILLV